VYRTLSFGVAPLAFLSPRIIAAIADGTAPADLTVTGLAKALPYPWAEQERSILQNT
jgi:site-specific DNA recombinase